MAEFARSEELAVGLYDRGCLQFLEEPVRTKSGRLTRIYYDQRGLMSLDQGSGLSLSRQLRIRRLAVDAYVYQVNELPHSFEHLYALPQSMTQLAGAIGYVANMSTLWGRVGTKDHGMPASVHGDVHAREEVVMLDDVITSGESAGEGARTLENTGLLPVGLIAMLDRMEGGRERLEREGLEVRTALSLKDMVGILHEARRVSSEHLAIYEEEYGAH